MDTHAKNPTGRSVQDAYRPFHYQHFRHLLVAMRLLMADSAFLRPWAFPRASRGILETAQSSEGDKDSLVVEEEGPQSLPQASPFSATL